MSSEGADGRVMLAIRVTTAEGATHTYPFPGTEATIGRDASNAIVLDGAGVSARHCKLVLQGVQCTLVERGSTNGTWLNNRRIDEPTVVTEDDRFYVGSYLVQVTRMAPAPEVQLSLEVPSQMQGPILRDRGPERAWRDMHDRLLRWAERWDEAGRPSHLSLRADELRRSEHWLSGTPPERAAEITLLQREFIAASGKVAKLRLVKQLSFAILGAIVLAGAGVLAWVMWPSDGDEVEEVEESEDQTDVSADPAMTIETIATTEDEDEDEDAIVAIIREEIEHAVIPFETLDEIARRYGVTVDDIASWNLLNPDDPQIEDKTLTIRKPKKRPLPQQKITYVVERGETWTKLAQRFDLSATRLREYNPDIDRLAADQEITVWIDPKPYKPREPRRPIPEFQVDERARSIGGPGAGRIENAIQMPPSDNYVRRAPNNMWGGAYMIANLQKALATFRQDVDFDGVIVVADMSRKGGGPFEPHSSHQAGRDVDIWLPTLKGVYKEKYLGDGRTRERRPEPEEADWYAVWGLVRALIKTDSVQYVFIDWTLQKYVYDAAKHMGATEEELDAWIQYPRGRKSSRAIFRHSAAHIHHIHVRFKCAPYERECR
jgi:hypothetical protein